MYLYNVIVSLANLNLRVIKGDKGSGKFWNRDEGFMCWMFSNLYEENFWRGEVTEKSVGPLLPFLSAWESEPVPLSSYLGLRLNLGLAKGKGALLRSKVSGEVLSWPFHPLRPWLWSHVSLLCGWYLWNYPWLQPTPLVFYILAVASAVSSSRLLGPLLLTSGWPLLPPVHLPEGAF